MYPSNQKSIEKDSAALREIGSVTAKGGFKFEEAFISECLKGWQSPLGTQVLLHFGANPDDTDWTVSAQKPAACKSEEALKGFCKKVDVQVAVAYRGLPVGPMNVSCKRFAAGFNQVHKQPCHRLAAFFDWSPSMLNSLRLCTGDPEGVAPSAVFGQAMPSSGRSLLAKLPPELLEEIVVWFSEHKKDFISATLTGVPVLGASHLAAYYPAQKLVNIHTMHDVVNVLSEGLTTVGGESVQTSTM